MVEIKEVRTQAFNCISISMTNGTTFAQKECLVIDTAVSKNDLQLVYKCVNPVDNNETMCVSCSNWYYAI